MTTPPNAASWARFEHLIDAMCPGDVVTVDEAVHETEMVAESVQLVLEALTRAELFEKHGEHFMRLRCSDSISSAKHRSA
jgi:hypothetical protein